MSLPTPSIALTNTCSTIYNNTLYSYSQDGFQSLSLTQGAQWNELSMGTAVSGAACVHATPTDGSSPEAFYVLGGSSSDGSYQGFQRYNFESDSWETLTPQTAVTQNRQYHSAVYLKDSSDILMYAGSQDGSSGLSTQTFTIALTEPYNVLAWESSAPPCTSPILLQWSSSQAVLIGGSSTNTDVMLFDSTNGWTNSSATLAAPLSSDITHATMVQGDDGSKNVYTFDMTVSPNVVSRFILVDAYGYPVGQSSAISSRDLEDRDIDILSVDKRDNLTEQYWPTYNSTLAPTSTRTNYALSQDSNGLVVISGGNDEDVLCMFNAYSNSWQNATQMLVSQSSTTSSTGLGGGPASITSSVSSTTSATASATSSAAAAASSSSSTTSSSTKILGAVLSSVMGALVFCIIILLVMRWRRKKQQRADSEKSDENDMAQVDSDRKDPYILEEPYKPRHVPQESQNSVSSMAILMNNIGGQGHGHKRGFTRGRGSDESRGSSLFKQKFKAAISGPIPQEPRNVTPDSFLREEKPMYGGPTSVPRPGAGMAGAAAGAGPAAVNQQGTRRSSGWNRYWSGGTTMNMLGFGSKRSTYNSEEDSVESRSHYADTRMQSVATQPSLVVNPLQLDRPGFNRVTSGSPTVSHAPSQFPLSEGMSGKIERSMSSSTVSSVESRHDAFSSGIPESVDDRSWTPIAGQAWGSNSRVPSSNYSQSQYIPPGIPTAMSRDHSLTRAFPQPPSRPQGDMSNMEGHTSDMSWLNLGTSNTRY